MSITLWHTGHEKPELLSRGLLAYARKQRSMSEERLKAEWLGVDLAKRAGEVAYVKTGLRLFTRQKKETLDKLLDLPRFKSDYELAYQIFDLNKWYSETVDMYGPLVARSIVQGYRTGAERVGFDVGFPSGDTRARAVALEVLEKTKGMNDTTAKLLAKQLGDGVENGEDVSQLAKRVEAVFGVAPSRARTIAQTAATPVFESGQHLAFNDAGIEERSWLTRRDGDVRDGHQEAEGQEVKIDEPFLVSGESLMYPGDTTGSAGNVINCRCTVLAKL